LELLDQAQNDIFSLRKKQTDF
jgi:predicted  nucleic acid-binding Zn-ribbon protein